MTNQSEVFLGPSERLDDLQRKGYQLIQNTKIFCYGIDAMLLAAYAKLPKNGTCVDLGCGNGVIPILMQARYGGKRLVGLEIQDVNVDLAKRNVSLNHLEESLEIVRGDIKEASLLLGKCAFDVVTSNPPYMDAGHGLTNPEDHKAIARHEILCTLQDVIREAAALLKNQGHFYMIHRPQRLVEMMQLMREYHLEPKRIRFVHPFREKEATMVLIDAVKGGNPQVRIEPPFIVYDAPGVYTEELMQVHHGDGNVF